MTPRLADRSRTVASVRRPRTGVVLAVASAGLMLLALAVLPPLLARPAHVPEIGVRNPQAWHATVAVSDGDGDSWVAVGRVTRDTERTFHEVLDQGDAWTFRFTYAGTSTELRLTRAELEQQGWLVDVPPGFATALEEAGRLPSADAG